MAHPPTPIRHDPVVVHQPARRGCRVAAPDVGCIPILMLLASHREIAG